MTNDVQYVINEAGERTAVILSLSDYEALLEDIEDLKVALERKNEELIPLKDMKEEFLENE